MDWTASLPGARSALLLTQRKVEYAARDKQIEWLFLEE